MRTNTSKHCLRKLFFFLGLLSPWATFKVSGVTSAPRGPMTTAQQMAAAESQLRTCLATAETQM